MKLLDRLKSMRQNSRVDTLYEKIEIAIRKKADLIAEQEFDRTMANFYTERLLEIDPNVDWWGFAQNKQKQHDHQESFTQLTDKIAEAEAVVKGRKAAFEEAGRARRCS